MAELSENELRRLILEELARQRGVIGYIEAGVRGGPRANFGDAAALAMLLDDREGFDRLMLHGAQSYVDAISSAINPVSQAELPLVLFALERVLLSLRTLSPDAVKAAERLGEAIGSYSIAVQRSAGKGGAA